MANLAALVLIGLGCAASQIPRMRAHWEAAKIRRLSSDHKKQMERALIRWREMATCEAKKRSLPDGVFRIACYNRGALHTSPAYLLPREVFPNVSPDLLADWTNRSDKLLSATLAASDALAGGECGETLRQEIMDANPGFSEETYSHAVSLGVGDAGRGSLVEWR